VRAAGRRLQANELPANIRQIFDKDTKNARDVRYYQTRYGTQAAYEAKWTEANGKEMKHYVSDTGTTFVRGEETDAERAREPAEGHEQAREGVREHGVAPVVEPRPVGRGRGEDVAGGQVLMVDRDEVGARGVRQLPGPARDEGPAPGHVVVEAGDRERLLEPRRQGRRGGVRDAGVEDLPTGGRDRALQRGVDRQRGGDAGAAHRIRQRHPGDADRSHAGGVECAHPHAGHDRRRRQPL